MAIGSRSRSASHRALRRVGVTPRPLAGITTTLHLVWRDDDTGPLPRRVRDILGDLGQGGSAA